MSLDAIGQAASGAGDDQVLTAARDWLAAGDRVVLAVVTAAWGSAPRGVGAYMAIREDGLFVGSVSGGCIEAGVVAAAEDMGDDETVRRLAFGITDEEAWFASLPCGGTIGIALFRPRLEVLDALTAALAARRPAALVLDLDDGTQRLVTDNGEAAMIRRIALGTSGMEGDRLFVRSHPPDIRLVVVGAVHVTQALCAMARMLGLQVVVVDPRRSFATGQRFPGVALVTRQPERALDDIRLDAHTAVVTLAHVPQLDDAALLSALGSPAFYIGALGSRRTHARRVQRLAGAGASQEALARIRSPVGIDIGSATPAEIALSVLAEIVLARRGPRRGVPSDGR